MHKEIVLLLLFFSVVSLGANSAETCPDKKVSVFFGNGMFTTPDVAQVNANDLKMRLNSIQNIDVKFAYQRSEPALQQLRQVMIQKGIEETSLLWEWFFNFTLAEEWFKEEIIKILANNSYISDQDLRAQIDTHYIPILSRDEGIIIVPHSQGNFYANRAWEYINSNYPEYIDNVRIVSVATPSSYTAGDGSHTNLSNDVVIQGVRTLSILPTISSPRSSTNIHFSTALLKADPLSHAFSDIYLTFNSTRERIVGHVVSAIEELRTNCPQQCAGEFYRARTGSSFTSTIDLGDISGVVKLIYKGFNPVAEPLVSPFDGPTPVTLTDTIELKAANGNQLFFDQNYGLKFGNDRMFRRSSYTFDFEPGELGGSDVTLRLIPDRDTNYMVSLSCPGGSNVFDTTHRINISMNGGGYGWGSCSGDLEISGDQSNSIISITSTGSAIADLTPGFHEFSLHNASCQCFYSQCDYNNLKPKLTIGFFSAPFTVSIGSSNNEPNAIGVFQVSKEGIATGL